MTNQAANIRPFNEGDYPGIAAVDKIVSPSYAMSADQLHRQDANQDPVELWNRFVAVDATNRIVGTANYSGRLQYRGKVNTFSIFVNVLPSHQGQGIGAGLFDLVLTELQPHRPYDLFTNILADDSRTVRFLHEREFVDFSWEHASKIDLTTFEPAQFTAELQRVVEQDIEIKTVLDLARDPDRNQKLYDLCWVVEQGDSLETDSEKPSLEQWSQWLEPASGYIFDTCMVACVGDKYIGTTALEIYKNTELTTGLTGVLADYRRRGIATALKIHSLRSAKALGYTAAYTWSNSTNHRMININSRLGFIEQSAWVMMKKEVKGDD